MKNAKGFTLLELLMVVIIIAILASIALPQYLKTAERSRAAEALTMIASIRESQQRFRALNPAFATVAQQCNMDIDIPGSLCAGAPAASLNWTYVVNDAATGPAFNATATRIGIGANVIHIDLATGATCSPGVGANAYGLLAGPC